MTSSVAIDRGPTILSFAGSPVEADDHCECQPSCAFVSFLSRIPTTKNKVHRLCAEMGHDGDHPLCEKSLCIREVG
jgi:hypothetical protein